MVIANMAVDGVNQRRKTRRGKGKSKAKAITADLIETERDPTANEIVEDELMIDTDNIMDGSEAPMFQPMSAAAQRTSSPSEIRRIPIPPHRMTPLKREWVNIFSPLTEMCGLQVRMNIPRRQVEIKVRPQVFRARISLPDGNFINRPRSKRKKLALCKEVPILSRRLRLASMSM